MKLFCAPLILVLCIAGPRVWANLGDTLDQAEARYGFEKRLSASEAKPPLIEGAREAVFEKEGWRIRCALLRATNGIDYIVREEYRKIWNSEVMKKGGVINIRDFERDVVFDAEAGNERWRQTVLSEAGPEVLTTISDKLLQSIGRYSRVWIRSDGGLARMSGNLLMTLDLPQARKYETEFQAIKEQKARDEAARFGSIPTTQNNNSMRDVAALTSAPNLTPPVRVETARNNHPPTQSAAPTPLQEPRPPILGFLLFVGLIIGIAKINQRTNSKPSLWDKSIAKPRKRRIEVPPAFLAPTCSQEPPLLPPVPRTVKDLTWDEFELLVGEIYRRQGFSVELCAGTGADGGIDLVLFCGSERVLVQCKSWNVYKVGPKEIREFFGVMVSEKADRGIFVTTGIYTRAAIDFAQEKPIEMIDGTAFNELINQAALGPNDDLLNVQLWAPVFFGASRVTIPKCPFCKTTMVRRAGNFETFWGCSSYPKCRGKRNMRRHAESCRSFVES